MQIMQDEWRPETQSVRRLLHFVRTAWQEFISASVEHTLEVADRIIAETSVKSRVTSIEICVMSGVAEFYSGRHGAVPRTLDCRVLLRFDSTEGTAAGYLRLGRRGAFLPPRDEESDNIAKSVAERLQTAVLPVSLRHLKPEIWYGAAPTLRAIKLGDSRAEIVWPDAEHLAQFFSSYISRDSTGEPVYESAGK